MQIGSTSAYYPPFTPDDKPGSQSMFNSDPVLSPAELKAVQAKMPAPAALPAAANSPASVPAASPTPGPEAPLVAGPITDRVMSPSASPEIGPITDRFISPVVQPPVSLTLDQVLSKLDMNSHAANPSDQPANGTFELRARFHRLTKQHAHTASHSSSTDKANAFLAARTRQQNARTVLANDGQVHDAPKRFNRIG
ncbi:MAG: hypothetical protein ABJC26_00690 [Gemmatimonadaceae bacterium]